MSKIFKSEKQNTEKESNKENTSKERCAPKIQARQSSAPKKIKIIKLRDQDKLDNRYPNH